MSNNVTGISHVVYAAPFHSTPAVAIVAQNMESGDWYEVYDKDEYGFYIRFKNSAGTLCHVLLTWVAKGFGKSYGVGGAKETRQYPLEDLNESK